MPENGILTGVERIHAQPAEIAESIRRLHEILRSPLAEITDELRSERDLLCRRLQKLPVVRRGGETTLDEVLRTLLVETPKAVLDQLTPARVWSTPPFNLLGRIAVAAETVGPERWDVPSLRDLFPIVHGESEIELPCFVPGRQLANHTYWMHFNKSFWSILIVTQYKASTSSTATGWEAAEVAGGLYAAAKKACEGLQLPQDVTPWDQFTFALVKAACCKYAQTTPRVPYYAIKIRTVVCNAYTGRVWEPGSGKLNNGCSMKEGYNTCGPVTDTITESFGSFYSGISEHTVEFEPGVGGYYLWT